MLAQGARLAKQPLRHHRVQHPLELGAIDAAFLEFNEAA